MYVNEYMYINNVYIYKWKLSKEELEECETYQELKNKLCNITTLKQFCKDLGSELLLRFDVKSEEIITKPVNGSLDFWESLDGTSNLM